MPRGYQDPLLIIKSRMREDDTTAFVTFRTSDFWIRAFRVPFSSFSKSTSTVIANMIGSFVSCDESDLLGWTLDLRVRVAVNIHKQHGVLIKLSSGVVNRIQLHHKRLLRICYACGFIGHLSGL